MRPDISTNDIAYKDAQHVELEASQGLVSEAASLAAPERHCEVFEGGLGI